MTRNTKSHKVIKCVRFFVSLNTELYKRNLVMNVELLAKLFRSDAAILTDHISQANSTLCGPP